MKKATQEKEKSSMPVSEVSNRESLMFSFSSLFSSDCDFKAVHTAWTNCNPCLAHDLNGVGGNFVDWCINAGKFFAAMHFIDVSVEGGEPCTLHDVVSANDEFDAEFAFCIVIGEAGVNYGDGCNMASIVKL